jgi:hypothetical protein
MRLRSLLSLLTLLLAATPLLAQPAFDWYDRGPYRSAVPRPEALLGFPLGSQHTMYHQQRAVLDQLIAAAPERVRTEVIGRTVEGKELRLLIISAPENIQRLDQIRADLDRLADPRTTSAAEAAQVAGRSPAVAMLSHSIHGAEPAGFEAVMQTAYQLLASDEPATLEILRHVVVVLNPTMNPDGHERLAAWNNSVTVRTDEPAAMEHSPPWSISARFNHYRFDMNRDVLAQSQAETRALTSAVLRWNPQVFVDLHSTTPQYFFPPWAQPINQNVPAANRVAVERYGRGNAAAFDRHGWQYYVRDQFDLHYPGYWDSWPSLNGAIGMTFETDGGPGIRIRKSDGTVTTFSDGIARHYVASMATLATLAANREQSLREYYDFRATGMAEVRNRPFKRVVVVPSGDPARLNTFLDLMTRQRIEVTRTSAEFTSASARDYLSRGAAGRRSFPAGSYVVDLAQPQARLATAILEPDPVVDSAFARRQLDMFERNRRRGDGASREGYEFYDITAWALPMTLGLEAYWTEDTPPVAGEPVTAAPARPQGGVSARAQSAYVWTGGTQLGARLAMGLMLEGVNVGAATEAMRADGRTWPRGSFVVRVARNDDQVHDHVATLAREWGVMVTAVGSAFPDGGQFGIGGSSVVPLRAPKILLAGGDGVSQTAFGDAWFYLERELELPIVPIELSALSRVNLNDYNIIIIPDGNAGTMWRQLQPAADRFKAWVREGGAVIAWGSGAQLLARSELELATIRSVTDPEPGASAGRPTPPADTTLSPSAQSAAPVVVSPTATDRPESVPGLIARVTLDPTHWITIGYERPHLAVPINGSWFMAPGRRGDNVAVLGAENNVLGGFTWPGNTERFLANSSWAVVEPQGRGTVVVFAQNPLFRAFWRAAAGMLNNAILFGPRR